MSASLLGRIYQSSLNQELDFETGRVATSYEVAYLVRVDDDCNDESSVLSADGLPIIGEESSLYPGLYVSGIAASESQEGTIWTVTVSYTSPQRGQGDGGSDGGGGSGTGPADPNTPPWLQPWKTSYSSQRKQSLKTQMIYLGAYADETEGPANPRTFIWQDSTKCPVDAYGNKIIPVTNSAGEPIYYDGERVLGVYTVVSYHLESSFLSSWLGRIGTLNSGNYNIGFFGTASKGKVLLETADIELDYWTPPGSGAIAAYYTMTRKFIYDPLGHWVEFADMGGLYFSSRRSLNQNLTEAKRAVDKDGNPTVLPLNGEGGLAEDGTSPMFLRYCPYPFGDW